jgi:hypothetical protein
MGLRIAVEDGLRAVRERLRAAGYDVVSAAGGVTDDVVAVVVHELDGRLLAASLALQVPLVCAGGRPPEEVAAEIHRRVRRP